MTYSGGWGSDVYIINAYNIYIIKSVALLIR